MKDFSKHVSIPIATLACTLALSGPRGEIRAAVAVGSAPAASGAPVQAQEWLQQARALRLAGQDAEAEALLRQVLTLPDPVPTSDEAGAIKGMSRSALAHERASAHQQIGEMRLQRGEYARALHAFRTRPPFPHWCGNGAAGQAIVDALWEAAALEGLGRWPEAIKLYARHALGSGLAEHPAPARRLEEIYALNGQNAKLLRFADIADARLRPDWRRDTEKLEPYRREESRPSRALRQPMRLRSLEERGAWLGLTALLDDAASARTDWLAEAAARALARHPREAVAALAAGFEKSEEKQWRLYALGLCATPEAVAFLKGWLVREEAENSWFARSLVFALALAGQPGADALAQAEPAARGNLLTALQLWRQGKLPESSEPGVRSGLSLPKLTTPARIGALPSGEELFRLAADPRTMRL